MNLGLGPLFDRLGATRYARFVVATVIRTVGSSYRKSGAMMLIPADGEPIGLVSGGCLESDLSAHAQQVFRDDRARVVRYDLSNDDTALWGLGLGCGGAITILLEPAAEDNGYTGLATVREYWQAGKFCWLAKDVTHFDEGGCASYTVTAVDNELPQDAQALIAATMGRSRAARGCDDNPWLLVPVAPAPCLVVCGAGPDAVPVANLAATSGWRVTVLDHRAHFADHGRFAKGVRTAVVDPAQAGASVALREADAAVVMGHHLQRDGEFVRALLAGKTRYIGLLGPAHRRDEVLALAGSGNDGRVYGPAGLAIGADLPATIAVSILAEAHAVLTGCGGGMLSVDA